MSLEAGTRLGPYEILSLLGKGGMGEVYGARDTRLERRVAVKVLPPEFASSAQRRARFEREARTISQLSHPHICTLFDVGDDGGRPYLVMELLEGETLAERLTRGPLPLDQVLRIGIEISDALARAHRAGVIHRDLKPGNIMLTRTGAKLLDFGLAKPHEPEAESLGAASTETVARALTDQGAIVGTLQYMAPEQFEGASADPRSDVFALGAVLYEMATGRPAFEGKTRGSIMAAVLTGQPRPMTELQPLTPLLFERVVRTCLEKAPDDRWQNASDVARALALAAGPGASAAAQAKSRRGWVWPALLGAVALAALLVAWQSYVRAQPRAAVRTEILAPDGAPFAFFGVVGAPPEISPDGQKVVFGASSNGKSMLFVRTLASASPRLLPGTEDARFPFWSPDSRWIAFFADGKLRKIDSSGGASEVLADVKDGRGGTWSRDGTILFGQRTGPLQRLSPGSGAVTPATSPNAGFRTHRWPRFLGDGRHFVFLAAVGGEQHPDNEIRIGSLDAPDAGAPLVKASSQPLYHDGRLLFLRDQVLYAQRVNVQAKRLEGEPIALEERPVAYDGLLSRGMFSVSDEGTLLYEAGQVQRESALTWFDRKGAVLGRVGPPARYNLLDLSPDDTRVAYSLQSSSPDGLWVADVKTGVRARATFSGFDNWPVWSSDGKRLMYASRQGDPATRDGRAGLFIWDAESGVSRPVVTLPNARWSGSWTSDGKVVFYSERTGGNETGIDLHYVTLDDGRPHVYLATPADETLARVSPDGRWVAFMSYENGSWQIYIAPFPFTGPKWVVPVSDATMPVWRADGKELFFMTSRTLYAVAVTIGKTVALGDPEPLFDVHPGTVSPYGYDVTADGQRFLINSRIGEDPPPAPLTLVQHFDVELRRAERERE